MNVFFGKDNPPIWLSLIGLFVIVITLSNGDYTDIDEAPTFIIGILALLCARQNYKWARKINRKGIGAYFVGLIFNLIGLGGYYLYYKSKVVELKPEIKEDTESKQTIETHKKETIREKAKRLIEEYKDDVGGNSDLSINYLGSYGGVIKGKCFIRPAGDNLLNRIPYSENEIIDEILRTNFDVKKAIDNLVEEYEVKEEAKKIEERDRKLRIKEKAERKVYGKVKTKRIAMKSEDKEAIFRKFGNKCTICGRTEGLHIHHKDKVATNNSTDNLIVLCGVCHKKIHMKVR